MAIYHRTLQGDSSQAKYDASRKEEIPPILPPSPDNIAGNVSENTRIQEVGQNLWEGGAFAEQRAQRRQLGASPVPPPGDGIEHDEYGTMFAQPLAQSGDPVADDHMNYYKSAKNEDEKRFLIKHSEQHGDEFGRDDGKISKKTQKVHDSLVNVYKKRNKLKEFKI